MTTTTIAVTPNRKFECDPVRRSHGAVTMELTWENDGYLNGEAAYDRENEFDAPVLRFRVYKGGDLVKEGNWITFIDARSPVEVRQLCVEYLFERLYYGAVVNELRPLIEELSSIEESWVTNPTLLPFREPPPIYPKLPAATETKTETKGLSDKEIEKALGKTWEKQEQERSLALIKYDDVPPVTLADALLDDDDAAPASAREQGS